MNKSNKKISFKQFIYRYGEDYLFLLPFFVLFTAFTIVPVLISIYYSFTYFNVLEPARWVGVNNYFQLFLDDSLFITTLKNTLLLSVITGPAGFVLSLVLSWLLNEFGRGIRTTLTLVMYAPAMAGGAVVIWQLIYSGDAYGLLNGFLIATGFINEPIQWLTDTEYMLPAAIVTILWVSLGTSFLSMISGLQNVDRTLYEAGAIDGIRNRWQELWYITLPSMKPQLMFSAVMSITNSFGMGDQISTIFGFPSSNYALHTMIHHLQDYGSTRFEMGYASAIATILFIIMIGSNQLVQKLLRRWGV